MRGYTLASEPPKSDYKPAILRYYPEEDEDRQALGRAIYQVESVLHQKCCELRKRKELELTLLQQPIRNWNGESIENMGTLRLMIQVKFMGSKSYLIDRLIVEAGNLHAFFGPNLKIYSW